MRQLTLLSAQQKGLFFSKLPMRQLTDHFYAELEQEFSKLPMRQLTTSNGVRR